MLFNYQAIDTTGVPKNGSIDAVNLEIAIASLQRRGLIISHIESAEQTGNWLTGNITFFDRVAVKDVVILSRQMSTLFEAQVSALRIFRLLASESEKPGLRRKMTEIADDLQSGNSISKSLSKHPDIFSDFYVNMVRAGEESGKLDETFLFLADYLDRSYTITSKVRGALVYPAFIILTFISVFIIMLTKVIPKISEILIESGQALPIYTRIVIAISDFLLHYGFLVLVMIIVGGWFFYKYIKTESGHLWFDTVKIKIPYLGTLYQKLYLARIADNMSTMLASGIAIAKTIDITAAVVGNMLYKNVLISAGDSIRAGNSISDSFGRHKEMPGIVTQMIKVGEESGELGSILKTLAKFYNREVITAVDTLIDLIEPILIIVLGIGIAVLLAAVIIPIYNFSGSIQ